VLPLPGDAADASPEPFETRHRTCDGRVLSVEVWTRDIEFDGRHAELVFASDVTERRALGKALIDAVANEQRRVGQELHDGLGQELTGLSLSARALATRAERESQPIAEDLGQLAALAGSCIQVARRITQGISPLSDAEGSLEAALDALAARSSAGHAVVLFRRRLERPLTLNLETRNHLYRIAQEAVQNALKHARAGIIEIELRVNAGAVMLSISDDGVGLEKGAASGGGYGMRTMKYRASAINAKLVVAPRRGGGVSVVCEVPQPLEAAVA
jgi:two-component system CheB/CheR fusion protein